jgi:hypothetical protein
MSSTRAPHSLAVRSTARETTHPRAAADRPHARASGPWVAACSIALTPKPPGRRLRGTLLSSCSRGQRPTVQACSNACHGLTERLRWSGTGRSCSLDLTASRPMRKAPRALASFLKRCRRRGMRGCGIPAWVVTTCRPHLYSRALVQDCSGRVAEAVVRQRVMVKCEPAERRCWHDWGSVAGAVRTGEANPDRPLIVGPHGDIDGVQPDLALRTETRRIGCWSVVSGRARGHEQLALP